MLPGETPSVMWHCCIKPLQILSTQSWDLFLELKSVVTGKTRMYFIFSPPFLLADNTIITVQCVTSCWWNSFLVGDKLSWVAPKGCMWMCVYVCVCWCRVNVWCVPKYCTGMIHRYDSLFDWPFSRCLSSCSHTDRNNAMAERDSRPFLKRLLQINKNSLLKLHPFPASGSQNIKSLEAEINPTWAYCQDLGFSRDCHLSAYHQDAV